MDKIKVGIIGAGSLSDYHMKSYIQNGKVELTAICDKSEARAVEKANKFGIPNVYTDYYEMLANPEIDAVSIITWNNLHAVMSIAALESGKHVLVEKPLCMTVQEALNIEDAVRRTGKQLQIGYVRRHATNAKVLKEFIDRGELGEIYYAKASFLRRLGNPGGWFTDKELSGGGPLIDLGVHIIDICWYLMGRPKVKSISGNTYQKLGNRAQVENLSFYKAADYDLSNSDVEDMANALIRFENGASLMVDVSYTLHVKQDELNVKIYGDKGGAELEPELLMVSEKNNTILNLQPQIDNLSFDFERAFQNEIDHFIECCRTNQKTNCPVEDGVEMMKILCGIYESSQKGMEIRFDK
jgi:predicted dehydrogenase